MRHPQVVRWLVGWLGAMAVCWLGVQGAIEDRTRTALEALSRLKTTDLNANPALKQAVLRVLDQVRGEPEFVDVVTDFKLPGFEGDLIQVAALYPTTPQATLALRTVLDSTNASLLGTALKQTNASRLVEVLGRTADPHAVQWLEPLVVDRSRSLPEREAAVKALSQNAEGARGLLAMAQKGALADDLLPTTGALLRSARWPDVKQAAEARFRTQAAQPKDSWPSVAELLRLEGDAGRGAPVFRRPEVGCITCHQVKGEGIDFGPKLTEIGSKLGKDALMTAILEPSSGIAFGFEAWRVELKNGEEWVGIVVSDTETELAIKLPGGAVTTVKKAEVVAREKQPLSLMPAGLHQSLSPQEFADLIAYLSSLKSVPARP